MSKTSEWKTKVSEIFNTCQDELKRTTEIGKKMLSASKMNTVLNETYEELGRITVQAIKEGELDWDDPRITELMKKIESFEKDIEEIEGDVYKIKFPDSEDKDH